MQIDSQMGQGKIREERQDAVAPNAAAVVDVVAAAEVRPMMEALLMKIARPWELAFHLPFSP